MITKTEAYRGHTIEWREGGERHLARIWTPKGDGFDAVESLDVAFADFQSQARRKIDDLIDGKEILK